MAQRVNIKSSRGLDRILSLLVEESVSKARQDILSKGVYPPGDDFEEEQKDRVLDSEKINQRRTAGELDALRTTWGKAADKETVEEDADDEQVTDDIFKNLLSPEKKSAPAAAPQAKAPPKQAKQQAPVEDVPEDEPDDVGMAAPQADSENAVSYTMIRDKLNTIRSGRSLRDRDIREELKSYITSLSGDEREALYVFLDGIAQIITAGIESDQAPDPGDDPHDIEMQKDEPPGQDQPVRKPVKRDRGTGEDVGAPIQVGGRQAMESVRRKFRELM